MGIIIGSPLQQGALSKRYPEVEKRRMVAKQTTARTILKKLLQIAG